MSNTSEHVLSANFSNNNRKGNGDNATRQLRREPPHHLDSSRSISACDFCAKIIISVYIALPNFVFSFGRKQIIIIFLRYSPVSTTRNAFQHKTTKRKFILCNYNYYLSSFSYFISLFTFIHAIFIAPYFSLLFIFFLYKTDCLNFFKFITGIDNFFIPYIMRKCSPA